MYDCMYASTCMCVPIRIQATWHAPPQLPSLPRRAALFPFELINLLAARATCVPLVSFTQDSSFRRLPCKEDKCLGNARLSTQRRRKVLSRVRRRIAASKSVFFFFYWLETRVLMVMPLTLRLRILVKELTALWCHSPLSCGETTTICILAIVYCHAARQGSSVCQRHKALSLCPDNRYAKCPCWALTAG